MKTLKRFLAVACTFLMAASFNGCASTGILPPQYVGNERQNYGRIGVVAARFEPQVKVDVLTSGKGAGALKGAGEGVLGVLSSSSACGIGAAFCAVIFAPVGAVGGAIYGAVVTESAEKIAAAEAAMKIRLEALKMQEILRDKVIEYAKEVEYTGLFILKDQGPEDMNALPAYRPATGERLDTVVELSLLSLEAVLTGEKGDPISVKATFRVRVVNASDGKVLDSFTHQSITTGTYDNWIKDNAKMLADAIQLMYRDFAEVVVDELFLNYRPVGEAAGKPAQQEMKKSDSESWWKQPMLLADYVLQPLYPEVRRKLLPFGDFSFGMLIVRVVDSPEPTFRWEAFPRLKELLEARAGSRITDVKYDLRIFNYRYFLKGLVANKQIYQVTGLTEPKFKLSGFFKPCHVYFWTVRARFLLDGTRQATEWSGIYYIGDARPWWWRRDSYPQAVINHPPNYFYYFPFRIPAVSLAEKCSEIPPSDSVVRGKLTIR